MHTVSLHIFLVPGLSVAAANLLMTIITNDHDYQRKKDFQILRIQNTFGLRGLLCFFIKALVIRQSTQMPNICHGHFTLKCLNTPVIRFQRSLTYYYWAMVSPAVCVCVRNRV